MVQFGQRTAGRGSAGIHCSDRRNAK